MSETVINSQKLTIMDPYASTDVHIKNGHGQNIRFDNPTIHPQIKLGEYTIALSDSKLIISKNGAVYLTVS